MDKVFEVKVCSAARWSVDEPEITESGIVFETGKRCYRISLTLPLSLVEMNMIGKWISIYDKHVRNYR